VAAHDLAHRGIAFNATQEVIFFRGHVSSASALLDIGLSLVGSGAAVELEGR
jgi:hypothetical protein